jgi:hypothetical protein
MMAHIIASEIATTKHPEEDGDPVGKDPASD